MAGIGARTFSSGRAARHSVALDQPLRSLEETPWPTSSAPPGPPSPARRRPSSTPSRELTPLSRAEPGNRFYQAYQDPAEPGVFRLFEIYDDEEAYAAHGASDHFKEFGWGQAIPVLAKRERAFYTTIG